MFLPIPLAKLLSGYCSFLILDWIDVGNTVKILSAAEALINRTGAEVVWLTGVAWFSLKGSQFPYVLVLIIAMLRKLVVLLAVDLMNLDFLKICALCETVVCNETLVRKKPFSCIRSICNAPCLVDFCGVLLEMRSSVYFWHIFFVRLLFHVLTASIFPKKLEGN